MQIKSLVALLPLLLGSVSSVALPAAPDSCGAVEARLRRNADLQDVPKHLLSRCVQRRELEAHLELVSRDIQQLEPSNNGQDHIISARAPPKDGNEDPPKRGPGRPKGSGKKKPTPAAAGPAGSPAEKTGEEKKEQDPANPPKNQNQPQQQPGLAIRPKKPANKNDPQPQAPADGSGSSSESDSESEKKIAEEKQNKGKKKAEDKNTKPPSDGPSDGDSSPSESEGESGGESEHESESEDEGSGSEFQPGSDSDSEAEKKKKQAAKDEARKKKEEEKEKQKKIDKERAPKTMYLNTTPNPKKSEGIKDWGAKEEERYYLRKVGDGLPRHRYKTNNPAHLVTESGDQIPGDTKTGQPRPGKVEENATTKHKGGKGGYPLPKHCKYLTL